MSEPIEIRFIVDGTAVQPVVQSLTNAGWDVVQRTLFPPDGIYLTVHLNPDAAPDDSLASPYKRLVLEFIKPVNDPEWYSILNAEQRETVLDMGFIAFARAYVEGQKAAYARDTAMKAMEQAAKDIGRVAVIVLKRDAELIRGYVRDFVAGKPDTVETGRAVAELLKTQGYSYNQVKFALKAKRRLSVLSADSAIRDGIQQAYKGA